MAEQAKPAEMRWSGHYGYCIETKRPWVQIPPPRRAETPGHRPVGAELAIHDGDLRHRWAVAVGNDRRPWEYDCYI